MTFRQETAKREPWSDTSGRRPSEGRAAVDCHDFTSVYDVYYSDVARWVRALGGPIADRADLVQEVFVVVHRRLADFDGQNLSAWLYRITANQVRDYRRLVWIRHIFRRSVEVTSDIASGNPTQLMVLETREKQRRLEKLLSRLTETLRATFVLFEVEGYTAEEIAIIQDVAVTTVRARIQRARKKLTAMLSSSKAGAAPGGQTWNR